MTRVAQFITLGLITICLAGLGGWFWFFRQPPPVGGIPRKDVDPDVKRVPFILTPPSRTPSKPSPIRFSSIPQNGGITFRHQTGTSVDRPFPAANGSGIAAVDFDRDGHLDLYFGTGTPFPIDPTRQSPHNQLYRQQGPWQFQHVTSQSGLGHNGFTAGLAVGDVDNDGFPDVFHCCFGPDVLFHNCGDGTFERLTVGVEDPRWGSSAAFLDFDQDGNLDLYVCNYGDWTFEKNLFCGNREKNVRIYCSPLTLEPVRCSLFRNLGDGLFADVSESTGIAARIARAQGVIAADFNQDGWTDLYVGNDLHANSLFMNTGLGKFEDATELSGTGYDERGQMMAGMGVDVSDVTGDGQFDLFVTNFEGQSNNLYENVSDKIYREATASLGLAADSMPWVGWGCALRDFDLDGADDVWVVNGHVDDNLKQMGKDSPYLQPSLIWHQEQGRFRVLGAEVGEYFAVPHPARALVVGDFDNDGDWDAVVGHQDDVPALLRNDPVPVVGSGVAASLELELIGVIANRDAIGATVTVQIDGRQYCQPVRGGGSYLSAPDIRPIFAVPTGKRPIEVEVKWAAGHTSRVTIPRSTAFFRIIEPRNRAISTEQSAALR